VLEILLHIRMYRIRVSIDATSFVLDFIHRLVLKSFTNLKILKKLLRFEGWIFLRFQIKKRGDTCFFGSRSRSYSRFVQKCRM
jgi:hypothetical protein